MLDKTIRRSMTSIVLTLLACYVVVVFAMFVWQDKLVYQPSEQHIANPRQIGLSFSDVWLTAADGVRTHAWYVAAPSSSSTTRTVLFFHGNAGNISHRLETLDLFHRLDLNVLMPDYRGYGRSQGSPSESGTELDAVAAWRYLREQRATPASAILIHGRSLGAGVALALAEQIASSSGEIGAVFIESAFTSVPDLVADVLPWFPARGLVRIHYPNLERIARLSAPLLIAHSPADEVIPFHHGERLHAAALMGARFLRMQGGHNDGFVVTGSAYTEAVSAFIERHLR